MKNKLRRAINDIARFYNNVGHLERLFANAEIKTVSSGDLGAPEDPNGESSGQTIQLAELSERAQTIFDIISTDTDGALPITQVVKQGLRIDGGKIYIGTNTDLELDNEDAFKLLRTGGLDLNLSKGTEVEDKNTVISSLLVNGANLDVKAKDSDALTIFLNAIPTVELSRCVPFIDVKLITLPRSDDDLNDASGGTGNSINLFRFLGGDGPDNSPQFQSAKVSDFSNIDILSEAPSDLDGIPNDKIIDYASRNASGMEIFTSPQTLVPGDEFGSGRKRTNKVLDPFRPFLSLESLSISIVPTVNIISYESGELKIKLHDRSRLGEIADLVRPDLFGYTTLMIEYGWSHPDAKGTDNPYGLFMNNLRVKKHYRITNTNFSFQKTGEVSIDLKIVSKGPANFDTVRILDDAVSSASKEIKFLIETIKNMTKKLPVRNFERMKKRAKVTPDAIFDLLPDFNSALDMSMDSIKKLRKLARELNRSKNPDFSNLAKKLTELVGTDDIRKRVYSKEEEEKTLGLIKKDREYLQKQAESLNSEYDKVRKKLDILYEEQTRIMSKRATSEDERALLQAQNATISETRDALNRASMPLANELHRYNERIRDLEQLEIDTRKDYRATKLVKPGKEGFLGHERENITNTFRSKISFLASTYDPYITLSKPLIRNPNLASNLADEIENNKDKKTWDNLGKSVTHKYVSLARIIEYFISSPLEETDLFNEIQFYYYQINENASYIRCMNIGSIPIELKSFVKMFNKSMKSRSKNITIGEFINFINSYVFDDISNPNFGFNKIYRSKIDKDGNLVINTNLDEGSEYNNKINVLKRAYNLEEDKSPGEIKFTPPFLEIMCESLPATSELEGESTRVDNGKTILRVHITDRQASKFTTQAQILKMATDGSIDQALYPLVANSAEDLDVEAAKQLQSKLVNLASDLGILIGVDNGTKFLTGAGATSQNVINFIKQTAPFVNYGSENTTVLEANIQSMNEPLLTTIHMMRPGGVAASSGDGDKLPMTFNPVQLSVNMLGCPIVHYLQYIFFDFFTNTNIDNLYGVNSIKHEISAGKFNTSIDLLPIDAYGSFRSLGDAISLISDRIDSETNPE